MEKRTREIIALVMLIVLGMIVAGAMAWYILVGHNWNQAATHIDDMVGSMDDYTVVVYDGVAKKPKKSDSSKVANGNNGTSAQGSSASSSASSIAGSLSAGAATGNSSSASAVPTDSSNAASEASASAGATESSSTAPVATEPSSAAPKAGSSSGASAGATDSSDSSEAFAGISVNVPDKKPHDAKTIAKSYREKGASVILIPKDAIRQFDDPVILYRNGKRIGVFSFKGAYKYRYPLLRSKVRYLQGHAVDYTICVAKDRKLLRGRLDGIDLLVLLRDAGVREGGEFRNQTFCVDSPYIGETQSVIVSPSGVMTSRTIREL